MSTVNIPLGASIQAAINANPAGTIFQLVDGVYRGEQFEPQNNDQFVGAPDGGTVLSGAIVLNNWTQSGGYWWSSGLPSQSIGKTVSGSNPLASNLNDLFVNNSLYTRVSSLSQVTAGTWYFDPTTNSVAISTNPQGQDIEYSVTPGMTYDNGATGVVFQNLTTERYATDAQSAPIQTGNGWQIINVTSTQNHGAGLYVGGAKTTVQGGNFVDNGQIGIDGSNAPGSQITGANISNNNYAGYNIAWDAGGIKITATDGLLISGNKVENNNGIGIWNDIDTSNATISNNVVSGNAGNGIQYEISHGSTSITQNTVSDNQGSGIYISNSDGVVVSGNTVTVDPSNVFNSLGAAMGGGIDVINNGGRGTDPSGTPYLSINDTVQNNVIIHPGDADLDGIWTFQELPANANNIFNSNTYYVPSASGTYWHFGDTDYTWSALHQDTSYESSGIEYIGQPKASGSGGSPSSGGSEPRRRLPLAPDPTASSCRSPKMHGPTEIASPIPTVTPNLLSASMASNKAVLIPQQPRTPWTTASRPGSRRASKPSPSMAPLARTQP